MLGCGAFYEENNFAFSDGKEGFCRMTAKLSPCGKSDDEAGRGGSGAYSGSVFGGVLLSALRQSARA